VTGPIATFSNLPHKPVLTLNFIPPQSWLVESVRTPYDLDNIYLEEVGYTSTFLCSTFSVVLPILFFQLAHIFLKPKYLQKIPAHFILCLLFTGIFQILLGKFSE
jgi:VIT1/CCC1 family predicted Fe2+/Mn2+ transporter